MTPRRSPLAAWHTGAGARMVDFGGWEMPLSYPAGTVHEHMSCRTGAAAFDVSHLGTVRVEGPGASDVLQRELSNDLRKIGPGRAQYSQLLDEGDGSVLDDVIVWWCSPEHFEVMPNASNTAAVVEALGGEDVTDRRALIAVQGPGARERVRTFCPEAAAVPRFAVTRFSWGGQECTAAGTGYTGEDGIECSVPSAVAASFWEAVVGAGAEPAGLGARDTLRLEAGLPLHGHELGPGITPLQAGCGWAVGWSKRAFRGRDALEQERRRGPWRRLTGVVVAGRRPPRAGQAVLARGTEAGRVTSGNFSPCLGRGIALCLVAGLSEGEEVTVSGARAELRGVVTEPPFAGASTRTAGPTGGGARGGRASCGGGAMVGSGA